MVKKLSLAAVLFVGGSLLASCSQNAPEAPPPPPPPGGPGAPGGPDVPPPPGAPVPPGAPADAATALKDPKTSISYQFDLIKAGDTENLKACFTPRVRDDIKAEDVEKAKGDAAKYTLDDLYASTETGEADGKKTVKVKMKDGKTLTTLVETDGQWLADTIWFK